MRLDARRGDTDWKVWHAEEMRQLKKVIWVDDAARQWAQVSEPLRLVGGDLALDVFNAKQIKIIPASRLVLINPLDDSEPGHVETTSCTHEPAAV